MQKLVFINGNGKEIDLTSSNFGIVNWEGFANTALNIQTQQVPFEDGGVYLDALMEQREIAVTVAIYDGNNLELRYQKKRELISALNPKLGEGVLIYTNDYLSRQIHAVPQIPIFENKNSNDAGTLKASVAFTCPNPYWEDVEDKEVNFIMGNLPRIENKGDVPTQMKIEFFSGRVVNPAIENLTTGKKIEYKAELEGGLLIDTNIGQKSVTTEDIKFNVVEQAVSIGDVTAFKKLLTYFCVGDNGLLKSSYDGIDWKVISSGTTNALYRIKEIEELGIYLIVGYSGTILISLDGYTWEAVTSGTEEALNGIAYSETLQKIFIVGSNGTIISSSDGYAWEAVTSGITDNLKGITYAEDLDLLVAVGYNRTILKSSDGETWERATTVSSGSNFYDVTYSSKAHKFVAGGLNGISYNSSDGSSWNSQTSAGSNIYKVVYSEKLALFIESCGVISGRSIVRTSADGVNWNYPTTNLMQADLYALCYSDEMNTCIASGEDGVVTISNDCRVWTVTKDNYGTLSGDFNSLAYSKDLDLTIAINTSLSAKKIGNGEWQFSTEDKGSFITYINEKKVFLKIWFGNLYLSSDGYTWEQKTENLSLRCIIYANNKYVAGSNGAIYTSTDLTSWTSHSLIQSSDIVRRLAYSPDTNLYIAITGWNTYKSSDANTWSFVQQVSGHNFYNAYYVPAFKKIFLIGVSGALFTTSDGVTYTDLSFDTNDILYGICFSNELNLLIIVGTNGKYYSSYDGENWEVNQTEVQRTLLDVVYSDNQNQFIICGASLTILESEYSLKENQIQKISSNSDMDLNLIQGENIIRLTRTSGDFSCRIKYRQKYIGV